MKIYKKNSCRAFGLCLGMMSGSIPMFGQSLTDGLEQTYEIQMSGSDGSTPLWLNSNRYGLSSLKSVNGYVRGRVERPLKVDDEKKWGIGYGVDLAVPLHYTSNFVIQQCYAEVRYKHAILTLGQKEQPMQLKNMELSSGSQTFGINARPIPEVRVSLPEYWNIPGTHHWLAIKGHFSYGWMTDGGFQEDWTGGNKRYCKGVLYHSKAGYMRIGPGESDFPFSLELGLEMGAEFGGTIYNTSKGTIEEECGFKSYINAFFAKSEDGIYTTAIGNQLGSWVARLNYENEKMRVSLYADHYFEDHSAMLFLDYDSYVTGEKWDTYRENRFLLYPLKDILVGGELQLKNTRWVDGVVVEFINTRFQSGPIYHDHTVNRSDHIGGRDNYYNHGTYQGWSHWGQVIGNPLYRSPIYNEDGSMTIKDNRFYAWHFGVSGNLLDNLRYRVLCSWQKGYGTYNSPFLEPEENLSVMGEATYGFMGEGFLGHCSLRAGIGFDSGKLLGDNFGGQLTFIYKIK